MIIVHVQFKFYYNSQYGFMKKPVCIYQGHTHQLLCDAFLKWVNHFKFFNLWIYLCIFDAGEQSNPCLFPLGVADYSLHVSNFGSKNSGIPFRS